MILANILNFRIEKDWNLVKKNKNSGRGKRANTTNVLYTTVYICLPFGEYVLSHVFKLTETQKQHERQNITYYVVLRMLILKDRPPMTFDTIFRNTWYDLSTKNNTAVEQHTLYYQTFQILRLAIQ